MDRSLETSERIAVLEFQVALLQSTVNETNNKLDELLTLRSKGVGAFWLASGLLGTGFVGAIAVFIDWLKG